MNPNNQEAYNNKGFSLYSLDKFGEAIKCYDKVIELNPNYSAMYGNKAGILCKINKYEEALKCYVKASELDPENKYYQSAISSLRYYKK